MGVSPFAEVLNTHFHGRYDQLFQLGGGYLQSDHSLIKRAPKKEGRLEYFTTLAQSIVRDGTEGIANSKDFVSRLNEEWTKCIFKDRKISLHETTPEEKSIYFSSRIVPFSFLSNFFPTLIVDEHRVYYSLEHAYLSWKVREAAPDIAAKISKGIDPKKAKQQASKIETSIPDRDKVEKMKELVALKFEQNPVLRQKLKQTDRASLQEKTKDTFWGIGESTEKPGKNYLGKTLMYVRSIACKAPV